jgi:hypothetical protein
MDHGRVLPSYQGRRSKSSPATMNPCGSDPTVGRMDGQATRHSSTSGAEIGTVSRVELVPAPAVVHALSEVVSGPRSPTLSWNGREVAGWWRGSRRFPLRWADGRWAGQGSVEVTPLTRQSCLVEVTLTQPAGLRARLAWPRSRLAAAANEVAGSLRQRIQMPGSGRVLPLTPRSGATRALPAPPPAATAALP